MQNLDGNSLHDENPNHSVITASYTRCRYPLWLRFLIGGPYDLRLAKLRFSNGLKGM